jgi:hypothetical protein
MKEECPMRRLSMLGTAAIFVALGVTQAYADNPNVPFWSPYAIMGHDYSTPTPTASAPTNVAAPLTEGRAADTNSPNRPETKHRLHSRKPLSQSPEAQ